MEILIEDLGSTLYVNNMIKITLLKNLEGIPELFLEPYNNNEFNVIGQNIRVIDQNLTSNSANNKSGEKKEPPDIDKIIAGNLGFNIKKRLLVQAKNDPNAIFQLGKKALDANKNEFAESLFKLAYKKGCITAAKYIKNKKGEK